MKHWTPRLSWVVVCRVSVSMAVLLMTPAAFCFSFVPIPTPSNMESPELQRFVAIRDGGEVRDYALRFLGEEAHRGRRVDSHERGPRVNELVAAGRLGPFDEDDAALILGVLERELARETPDWEHIEWALIASKYGRLPDARLVPLVRRVMEFPRGEKISDSHGKSLQNAVAILRHVGTESARSLLTEAGNETFWKAGGPARSSVISTDAEESLRRLRSMSTNALEPSPWHPDGSEMLARPHMAESLPSAGAGEVWENLVRRREACETAVEQEFARLATMTVHRPIDGRVLEELTRRSLHNRVSLETETPPPEPSDDVPHDKIMRRLELARASAVSEQLLEYALHCMAQELEAREPDWAIVDEALRICFHADTIPEEAFDPLRKILVHPRDAEMSEDHSEALLIALTVMGRVGTQDAVDQLMEATSAEFWKASGFVHRPARMRLPDSIDPLDTIRTEALYAISYAPRPLSRGVLEEIRDNHAQWAGFFGSSWTYDRQAHGFALRALRLLDFRHPPEAPHQEDDR